MVFLSEVQLDALVEMFNISIGRAAAAMSKIVNEEITLTVPSLKFLSVQEASAQLYGVENKRVCGVMQHFEGPFTTDALLMFPEDHSLEIVRMMLGESYSLDELSDLEQEAMSEVGNIILNACIGSIANMTNSQFSSTLPEVQLGLGSDLLKVGEKNQEENVLLIYIDFIIAARTIRGYMAFLMDVPSINGLIESINRFLATEPA